MLHIFHRNHPARPWAIATSLLFILLGLGIWQHVSVVRMFQDKIQNLEEQNTAPATPSTQTPATPETKPNDNGAVYTNNQYAYTVRYPAEYQVKVYNDENATIGTISGSGLDEVVRGKIDLNIATATTNGERTQKLEDFIFAKTKLRCDADGGGASITCPKKKSLTPLTLDSGLTAYTLTLEEATTTFVPTRSTVSDDRVMYIVDLSNSTRRTILIIEAVADGTDTMAETIARSAASL